jgi:hypothetical protein
MDSRAAKAYRQLQQHWKFTRTRAAELLGLSTYVLKEWEHVQEQPAITENSLRGRVRTFSDDQIEFVVRQWKGYSKERKRVKIKAFMKHLNQNWQHQSWLTPVPSRKTVEDILLANDCRKPKPKTKPTHKPRYHPPVKRHFPHAQTVLDGKQVVVSVNGHDYTFVLELCKDMATDAIGGYAVGYSETAELVKQAFNEYCSNNTQPLSTLVDNGSGNVKAAVDLGARGVLMIKAYPYRPETKGQIEGEFSLFERKVSHIVIDGKTEKEQAMSILKKVVEVYLRLRNQTPRCSVCPFTPKKLMNANVDKVEADKAYQLLMAQKDRRKQQAENRLKVSQEFNALVDSIVKEQKLTGDMLTFKKSIKWIELSTLRKAEAQFALQSQRDTFDSGKRTMAYFCAIARNMQLEKDQLRHQQAARLRYGLDQEAKRRRDKIATELAFYKDKIMLEKQPHLVILNAVKGHMNLPESFRDTVSIFKNQIDEALHSIMKKRTKIQRDQLISKTHQEIMKLTDFSLETRYELINQIKERLIQLTENKAKVVTPL